MTVVTGILSTVLLPTKCSTSRLLFVKRVAQRRAISVSRLSQASSATVSVETNSNVGSIIEKEKNRGETKILACPLCYNSLALITQRNGTMSPVISFHSERGWRQNFIWVGFSGLEKECEMKAIVLQKPHLRLQLYLRKCVQFEMAKDYLKPVLGVLDYSETMLRQCYELFNQEENFPNNEKLVLVQADIARLPFLLCSVEAVHAGAALHCWPSPTSAVAEISRVLRPGGVFVASTFIFNGPLSFVPFRKNLSGELMRYTGSQIFLSEHELEDICRACGLVGFTCVRNGPFIMLSATKPR